MGLKNFGSLDRFSITWITFNRIIANNVLLNVVAWLCCFIMSFLMSLLSLDKYRASILNYYLFFIIYEHGVSKRKHFNKRDIYLSYISELKTCNFRINALVKVFLWYGISKSVVHIFNYSLLSILFSFLRVYFSRPLVKLLQLFQANLFSPFSLVRFWIMFSYDKNYFKYAALDIASSYFSVRYKEFKRLIFSYLPL